MASTFAAIPIRTGDDPYKSDYDNSLREAGVALEGASASWLRFSFPHTDFTGFAALTGDIEIASLVAKGLIEQIVVKHTTLFVGSGITSLKADVGITGDLTRYLALFDLLAAVADTTFNQSISNELHDFGAVTSLRLQLTAVGANLDQLTDGDVDVYIKISTLPNLVET